jgi:hypothetical protein
VGATLLFLVNSKKIEPLPPAIDFLVVMDRNISPRNFHHAMLSMQHWNRNSCTNRKAVRRHQADKGGLRFIAFSAEKDRNRRYLSPCGPSMIR